MAFKQTSYQCTQYSKANIAYMSETRFRFPSLRSAVSVDSAVGSQHSSTDEDKSSEDNDEASQDSVSTDEVRAFGLKIKLLSVKLIYLVEFNIKHYLLHINVRRMRVPRTPAS